MFGDINDGLIKFSLVYLSHFCNIVLQISLLNFNVDCLLRITFSLCYHTYQNHFNQPFTSLRKYDIISTNKYYFSRKIRMISKFLNLKVPNIRTSLNMLLIKKENCDSNVTCRFQLHSM